MPGNPLNITLPTVGSTVGPDYATDINNAIQTIVDDVEAKVLPDEIRVNADFSYSYAGTSYGAVDVDRVSFTGKASLPSGGITESFFVYDGEVYFQDGSGNNVQISSAGSLAAAAGNITTTGTPAYATNGVQLQWSGGDLEYRFIDDGTNGHAGIVIKDVQLRNGANSTTLESAVTADYTLTLPAAAPGSTQLCQVASSGAISFSNTIVEAVTCSNLITASAGVTCAANQDVTVSGTGVYKHGTFEVWVSPVAGTGFSSGGVSIPTDTDNVSTWSATSAGAKLRIPVTMKVGKTVESVDVYWNARGAVGTKTFIFFEQDMATAIGTNLAFVTSTSTTSAIQTTSVFSGSAAISTGKTYMFGFTASAGGGEEIVGIKVTYSE